MLMIILGSAFAFMLLLFASVIKWNSHLERFFDKKLEEEKKQMGETNNEKNS